METVATHEALWQSFGFRAGGPGHAFAVAQVALARQGPELLPYLFALQRHVSFDASGSPAPTPPLSPRRVLVDLAGVADRLLEPLPARRLRCDVLLCGVWLWERPAEIRLWREVVDVLLQQGRSVGVLLHGGTELAARLRDRPDVAAGRLRLIDPRRLAGRTADRLRAPDARRAGDDVFDRAREILAGHEIRLDDGARDMFRWIAARGRDWRRWAGRLDFDAVLVRCHWLPLARDVTLTGLERGVPVATLQQGVVSHGMDAPLTAHRLAAFGPASRDLLARLDDAFAEASGRPVDRVDLLSAGPFLDPIPDLRDSKGQAVVLVLDQAQPWALAYYGLAGAQGDVVDGLRALLGQVSEARVVIRPHPAATDAVAWKELLAAYPGRVTLSPRGRSLAHDLEAATAAVTFFSGAGPVAAAAGRPVLFHAPRGGVTTPELEPFAAARTSTSGALAERLRRILTDPGARALETEHARAAGRAYFGDRDHAELHDLLPRLLAPV